MPWAGLVARQVSRLWDDPLDDTPVTAVLSTSLNENSSVRSRCSSRPGGYFHVLPKSQKETHKPLDGKAIEPVVLERGDLRLTDIQPRRCRDLIEPLSSHQSVNVHCEAHFRIQLCRIREPEIRKHVARAGFDRDALTWSSCHIESRIRAVRLSGVAGPCWYRIGLGRQR